MVHLVLNLVLGEKSNKVPAKEVRITIADVI